MLIRGWELSRLFENEADGAGEGAGSGTAVADAPAVDSSPAAASEATTTRAPLDTEQHATFEAYFDALDGKTPGETFTEDGNKESAEGGQPTADKADSVTAESGDDAVGQTTDDAGDETVVDVQRNALVALAKAYDWSEDELKGFTREQLQRLIAREEQRRPQPAQAKPEAAAEAAPTPPIPVEDDATKQFNAWSEKRKVQLENQGYSEEDVAIELERDRLLFHSNMQLQHQLQSERARSAMVAELRDFDSILGREIAELGFQDLVGKGQVFDERGQFHQVPGITEAHLANRKQVLQLYSALKQARPNVPTQALAWQAFNGVFGAQIAHRSQAAQSRKVIEHSKRRMGSPTPTAPQKGVEWKGPTDQDPELVSAMQRVQSERRQRVGSR